MESFVTLVHVVICVILIGVILVQSGKGASMGAMLGGGGSQTVFGARGPATFFHKFTTAAAVLFLVTSIGLARFAKTVKDTSVIDTIPASELVLPTEDTATEPTPDKAPPAEAEKTEE